MQGCTYQETRDTKNECRHLVWHPVLDVLNYTEWPRHKIDSILNVVINIISCIIIYVH